MNKSWLGSAIVGFIVLGVGTFLSLNLETRPSSVSATAKGGPDNSAKVAEAGGPTPGGGAPIREYPIGDEVEQNHIRVAAVWLPAVTMEGMTADPGSQIIHIEADIKALADNPNGFAKEEKVDYLKVHYSVVRAEGGTPVATGELTPMMARDGFHYGASIAMPEAGRYRLLYDIQPPSAGGLGRHSDAATGVAPWWAPFQVAFDWTVTPEDVSVASH